jgi:vacuolar protein sorting-associated protein 18
LDIDLTLRLISSHGQLEEVLNFSLLIENYEKVISQHIIEGNYESALEILSKKCLERKYENHFYKFSPKLMEHLPNKLISTFKNAKFLEPSKLIPALMRYEKKIDHKEVLFF